MEKTQPLQEFLSWEDGYFDIHHINTGSGNSTFIVLPDGTTKLYSSKELKRPNFDLYTGI